MRKHGWVMLFSINDTLKLALCFMTHPHCVIALISAIIVCFIDFSFPLRCLMLWVIHSASKPSLSERARYEYFKIVVVLKLAPGSQWTSCESASRCMSGALLIFWHFSINYCASVWCFRVQSLSYECKWLILTSAAFPWVKHVLSQLTTYSPGVSNASVSASRPYSLLSLTLSLSLSTEEIRGTEGRDLTVPCHAPNYLNTPSLDWSFSHGEDPAHILTYDSQSGHIEAPPPWDSHVELDAFRVPFGDGSLRLMDPNSGHTGIYTCVFSAPHSTHTEHTDVMIANKGEPINTHFLLDGAFKRLW